MPVSVRARLLALVAAWPAAAQAQSVDLVSPATLSVSGDARLVTSDGEPSWLTGGLGKLRSGGETRAELGSADLVWQPRFGWAIGATVVATLNGGHRMQAGISEAYLTVRPARTGAVRPALRAGLMWVPLSLEHSGADWHVRDTITPSAINSWVGEELSPLAVEGSVDLQLGEHQLALSAAVIAANDTAGALLTFRGWALHDRKTLAGRREPLPPLAAGIEEYQPHYTHPLLDVAGGFARRPGYYAKLAWSPPLPLRIELLRYDNRGDPEAANLEREWAWRTQFDHVGVSARLGPRTNLRAQAMAGRTRMGLADTGTIWIDNRFRSAFALVTRQAGAVTLAGRVEAFGTKQRGSVLTAADSEHGWAATGAVSRALGPHVSIAAELLHVSSVRGARTERLGSTARQTQTQLQTRVRVSW